MYISSSYYIKDFHLPYAGIDKGTGVPAEVAPNPREKEQRAHCRIPGVPGLFIVPLNNSQRKLYIRMNTKNLIFIEVSYG